jgi:NAD(P)-dependent dehydrogenase (short-subunit alcohol dehydrogenase family)
MSKEVAVIVGVGPGLGRALVARCSSEGMAVAAVARDADRLREVTKGLRKVTVYGADASDSQSLKATFRRISADLGEPDLVIFNAGTFEPGDVLNITPEDFERCWQIGCLGGLITAQEAAKQMLPRGHGTIIFTGATAALRGSKGFVNLAVPKFGLRALSQCLARELGPKGIHVAHVIIDGQIESERHADLAKQRGADALLKPKHIADAYMTLHRQERDTWTQELDMRPWSEKF